MEKDDLKTVSKEENFALFTLFVVGVDVGGNIKKVAWKKMISHSIQRGEIRAFHLVCSGGGLVGVQVFFTLLFA